MNADCQWWDLCKNSKTVIIDSIKQVTPLVEMVDNFANNRRLASIFEVKAGKVKLIFTSINLFDNLNQRPVARQLRNSLLNYMEGADFSPSGHLEFSKIKEMLLNTPQE